jgi:hypothetical protein
MLQDIFKRGWKVGWIEEKVIGISLVDETILEIGDGLFKLIGIGVDFSGGDQSSSYCTCYS